MEVPVADLLFITLGLALLIPGLQTHTMRGFRPGQFSRHLALENMLNPTTLHNSPYPFAVEPRIQIEVPFRRSSRERSKRIPPYYQDSNKPRSYDFKPSSLQSSSSRERRPDYNRVEAESMEPRGDNFYGQSDGYVGPQYGLRDSNGKPNSAILASDNQRQYVSPLDAGGMGFSQERPAYGSSTPHREYMPQPSLHGGSNAREFPREYGYGDSSSNYSPQRAGQYRVLSEPLPRKYNSVDGYGRGMGGGFVPRLYNNVEDYEGGMGAEPVTNQYTSEEGYGGGMGDGPVPRHYSSREGYDGGSTEPGRQYSSGEGYGGGAGGTSDGHYNPGDDYGGSQSQYADMKGYGYGDNIQDSSYTSQRYPEGMFPSSGAKTYQQHRPPDENDIEVQYGDGAVQTMQPVYEDSDYGAEAYVSDYGSSNGLTSSLDYLSDVALNDMATYPYDLHQHHTHPTPFSYSSPAYAEKIKHAVEPYRYFGKQTTYVPGQFGYGRPEKANTWYGRGPNDNDFPEGGSIGGRNYRGPGTVGEDSMNEGISADQWSKLAHRGHWKDQPAQQARRSPSNPQYQDGRSRSGPVGYMGISEYPRAARPHPMSLSLPEGRQFHQDGPYDHMPNPVYSHPGQYHTERVNNAGYGQTAEGKVSPLEGQRSNLPHYKPEWLGGNSGRNYLAEHSYIDSRKPGGLGLWESDYQNNRAHRYVNPPLPISGMLDDYHPGWRNIKTPRPAPNDKYIAKDMESSRASRLKQAKVKQALARTKKQQRRQRAKRLLLGLPTMPTASVSYTSPGRKLHLSNLMYLRDNPKRKFPLTSDGSKVMQDKRVTEMYLDTGRHYVGHMTRAIRSILPLKLRGGYFV